MKEYIHDVPVALIFFNRPEQFAKVFEQVKNARPSKLFLIQDGPRKDNQADVENIAKCREVLKKIDWDCEVVRDFSEENLGCGKRVFSGISKCFEKVDRLIILEDDCVPSKSFFPFCCEILEKYKDDERVGMISGMNHLGQFSKITGDYLFSEVGSIAGWATWKRVWKTVTYDLCATVQNKQAMRILENQGHYSVNRGFTCGAARKKAEQMQKGKKMSSWSTQFSLQLILNNQLILTPRVNLMTNIGLTEESANSVGSIKLIPQGLRPLYRLKNYEMEFPLTHPQFIANDFEYGENVNKIMYPKGFVRICRKIESVFLRVIHGEIGSLIKGVKNRLGK